jgi:tRNA pseudouridine(38-40) synthase
LVSQILPIPRSALRFRFSSRTDGGVHVLVAVNLPDKPSHLTGVAASSPPDHDQLELLRLSSIRRSISNSRLPTDISISHVSICHRDPNFDPRQGVQRKQYSYTVKCRQKVQHLLSSSGGPDTILSALDPPTVWICPWSLDDSDFDTWCQQLSGTHDYTAFCHKAVRRLQQPGLQQQHESVAKTNVLTVTKFFCERQEQPLHQVSSSSVAASEAAAAATTTTTTTTAQSHATEPVVVTARFVIEAQGFRRSMIRNLIGFLVDLACGAIKDEAMIQNLLQELIWLGMEDVATLVHQAPACGLCLEHVWYADEP